ncbi:hypothetical protein HNY73_016958 [Argiope bruennichi]|uniref:Uncharacterized protein n=1 Tax=Argiope bruennichi TaxID=94029 RepID=A0A8T0EPE7_ARGBR|nr:hypothetical protein HNY73_016958 [Argiope bruennichi]
MGSEAADRPAQRTAYGANTSTFAAVSGRPRFPGAIVRVADNKDSSETLARYNGNDHEAHSCRRPYEVGMFYVYVPYQRSEDLVPSIENEKFSCLLIEK